MKKKRSFVQLHPQLTRLGAALLAALLAACAVSLFSRRLRHSVAALIASCAFLLSPLFLLLLIMI